jgi:uncharacterized protein
MTSALEVRGLATTVDGELHLVGARCNSCGTHTFPVQASCPRCGSDTTAVALPREGSLWSCTVQRTRPKPPYAGPDEFEPFAVGYVDLGPLRIESRLEGKAAESWTIDERVHLVVGQADPSGHYWNFWFEGDNR